MNIALFVNCGLGGRTGRKLVNQLGWTFSRVTWANQMDLCQSWGPPQMLVVLLLASLETEVKRVPPKKTQTQVVKSGSLVVGRGHCSSEVEADLCQVIWFG